MITRLLIVIGCVGALVCGLVVAVNMPTGDRLVHWIGAGIISAGVGLLGAAIDSRL